MSVGPVTLRRWQAEAMPLALSALEKHEPGLVVATTGCHAAGQGILRHDGSIVNVEDVRVGDLLMGPDSTPRRVIQLCRGRAPMYEIRPTKGEPWVVNGDHVLTVQDTRTEASGALLDVTVHEWLTGGLRNPLFPEIANPKRQPDRVGTRAYWKLVRTGVEFPAHTGSAAVEPYLLGVLLGDGCLCNTSVSVTSADAEVVAEMQACAQRLGLSLTVANKPGTPAQTLTFSGRCGVQNPLRAMISELGLSGTRSHDKFIPRRYLTGSRHERLEVLAGLIDTDGALSNGGYDYVSQSQRMAGEVAFIARSLGLAAYCAPCEKRDQNGNGGTYYRVSISGDCSVVPVRIPRKRAEPRQQIKSVLRTGFEVVPLNYEDDFYGFTLDGDHRYLLADFTVTHNSGKSIFLAELLRQWRERHSPDEGAIVVTTPSRPLVEQLSKTIGEVLGAHVVGRYYTKAKQHKREVIVCCNPSVPLLALKLEEEGRKVAVWVADECFPAGTPIVMADGSRTPIEQICDGDLVASYDEEARQFVARPVVGVMRRTASEIVTLHLSNGTTLTCTPNHPVLTTEGWVAAGASHGYRIVSKKVTNEVLALQPGERHGRGLSRVRRDLGRGGGGDARAEGHHGNLSRVRAGLLASVHTEGARAAGERFRVLFRRVPQGVQPQGPSGEHEAHVAALLVGANAHEQPHAQAGDSRSHGGDAPQDQAQAGGAGWERTSAASAAGAPVDASWVADGGRRPNTQAARQWVSAALQGGHRESGSEDRDRGGRRLTLRVRRQGAGREESGAFALVRVDRVEVQEPGGSVGSGGVRGGCAVYNFEVEGTHTYLVNDGIVVHNCHKTTTMEIEAAGDEEGAALSEDAVSERLNAERRLGVTATPFRSNEKERLRLFTRVVYRYPPADALRDGVIVPWRFIPWEGDDTPIDRACAEMIVALGGRATRGPGVVNAANIEDAEAYCGFLANYGLEARPIHSKLSAAEQKANVEALRTGAIDCLVHVSMLVEGVDYPWLRWGCFRREVGARVRFIQELGRYLRAYPGKTEALILDPHNLADAFQVTYEEALGWVDDEDEGDGEQERKEREERELRGNDGEEPRVVMAKRVGVLSRYVRQLHLALIAEGVCQAPAGVGGSGWRNDAASPKQVAALQKMVRVSARLGREHWVALGKIAERPDAVTKGLASDALDLLQGVRNLPGGEMWRPAVPIEVPPDIAFEPVVDPIVYVAGAMKGGWAAVAIVQGGRTLYTQARPSRNGDRWHGLTMAAMRLACDRYGAREIGSTDPDVVAAVPSGVVGRLVTRRELNPAERVVWRTIREAERDGAEAAS